MDLIYFSPTGTTRAIVEAIGRGLDVETPRAWDLTFPRTADLPPKDPATSATSPVVIGMPVYAGRLPVLAVERMRQHARGMGRPAVLVVVYGNRAFEDALLELRDLAERLDFIPVAGAAFIGEHSFSTTDWPIAPGRPDSADTSSALSFGQQTRIKLDRVGHIRNLPRLLVPGNSPYRDGMPATLIAPDTLGETCMLCGACVQACPSVAITVATDGVETDKARCLRCCACIRTCPHGARVMHARTLESAQKLHNLCGQRKDPEFFI